MSGVDIMTVKELLGHKTLSMTLRYSHLSPAHKQIAVNNLQNALGFFQADTSDSSKEEETVLG